MSRSLVFSLTLLIAALPACGPAEGRHEKPEQPIAVATSAVRKDTFDALYQASGTVRGRNTAVLTSKAAGYVRSVRVQPGDRVVAGQLLAVLEANDVEASVRRARAGLEQAIEAQTEAQNSLKASAVAATLAHSTQTRVATLFAEKAVPQQEFDAAEARASGAVAQEEMAQARLRSAASRIDQAKAEVSEAQATLDYARITSPFTGRVLERKVDPGNLASPGMALLVVGEEGKLRVEASVDESHASTVSVGDVASVAIDALPAPLRGTVGEVVPSVDVASRAFQVKVDLPSELAALRPGMFARVSFRVGTREHLVVAATAITSSGSLDRVFVVEGDRARLRMVTVGEAQGQSIDVLSGLAAGERVVTAPPPTLRDGALISEIR